MASISTRFYINAEAAVSELERRKLNTDPYVHCSITMGLPYTVNETNSLTNSKDWTLK